MICECEHPGRDTLVNLPSKETSPWRQLYPKPQKDLKYKPIREPDAPPTSVSLPALHNLRSSQILTSRAHPQLVSSHQAFLIYTYIGDSDESYILSEGTIGHASLQSIFDAVEEGFDLEGPYAMWCQLEGSDEELIRIYDDEMLNSWVAETIGKVKVLQCRVQTGKEELSADLSLSSTLTCVLVSSLVSSSI